jgi:hypothetical protein
MDNLGTSQCEWSRRGGDRPHDDREYGRAIPQIIEEVRRNVISRVENQAGYGVAKANITVKDVLLPRSGFSRLGLQPEGEQTAKVEDEEQNSAPSSRARSSSSRVRTPT